MANSQSFDHLEQDSSKMTRNQRLAKEKIIIRYYSVILNQPEAETYKKLKERAIYWTFTGICNLTISLYFIMRGVKIDSSFHKKMAYLFLFIGVIPISYYSRTFTSTTHDFIDKYIS